MENLHSLQPKASLDFEPKVAVTKTRLPSLHSGQLAANVLSFEYWSFI
jgi:hypothetical protein